MKLTLDRQGTKAREIDAWIDRFVKRYSSKTISKGSIYAQQPTYTVCRIWISLSCEFTLAELHERLEN